MNHIEKTYQKPLSQRIKLWWSCTILNYKTWRPKFYNYIERLLINHKRKIYEELAEHINVEFEGREVHDSDLRIAAPRHLNEPAVTKVHKDCVAIQGLLYQYNQKLEYADGSSSEITIVPKTSIDKVTIEQINSDQRIIQWDITTGKPYVTKCS